jgi:hypothetical protein
MATKRKIVFWHGRDKKLEAEIEVLCRKEGDDYYWYGSLDEFKERYCDKFIVYPECICITQYGNWGQR